MFSIYTQTESIYFLLQVSCVLNLIQFRLPDEIILLKKSQRKRMGRGDISTFCYALQNLIHLNLCASGPKYKNS